jgi:hypothetical protein
VHRPGDDQPAEDDEEEQQHPGTGPGVRLVSTEVSGATEPAASVSSGTRVTVPVSLSAGVTPWTSTETLHLKMVPAPGAEGRVSRTWIRRW